MATATRDDAMAILARYLGNGQYHLPPDMARYIAGFIDGDDELPADIARYILTIKLGKADQECMHDLIQRNQADALSAAERRAMFASVQAGTMLSILKSKARRALKAPPPVSRYRKNKA